MSQPTLKFKNVFVYGGTPNFDVDFLKPYLIVDIICPDAPVDSELSFNRSNLKPYELCVQRRLAGDYLYNKESINQIEKRSLYGLYPLFQSIPTAYDDGMLFFTISYLEFNTI